MTLLTPPHSRSDKENRSAAHSMSARVAWSQENEYHSATSPICTRKLATSASKELPVRSILKQTSYPILPLLFPENERQVTPEPGDPLSDLHYLDRPSRLGSELPSKKPPTATAHGLYSSPYGNAASLSSMPSSVTLAVLWLTRWKGMASYAVLIRNLHPRFHRQRRAHEREYVA